MIDVGNLLLMAGAALLLIANAVTIALWRMQHLERQRLRRDHRIHVIVDRTRTSLLPQGNAVQFSPLAERNAHDV